MMCDMIYDIQLQFGGEREEIVYDEGGVSYMMRGVHHV
jgi:hypothetical protein